MERVFDPVAMGIKNIIEEKGLVQRFVAKKAGFSEQQFSSMINGRKVIRACDMIPIAKALDVEIAEIYDSGTYGRDGKRAVNPSA